jgi:hypothetical protein
MTSYCWSFDLVRRWVGLVDERRWSAKEDAARKEVRLRREREREAGGKRRGGTNSFDFRFGSRSLLDDRIGCIGLVEGLVVVGGGGG